MDTTKWIDVRLVDGVEGQCVVVNDYRICGPKPWGGGTTNKQWKTTKESVLRAFLDPDESQRWLRQELRVIPTTDFEQLAALRCERDTAVNEITTGFDVIFPCVVEANDADGAPLSLADKIGILGSALDASEKEVKQLREQVRVLREAVKVAVKDGCRVIYGNEPEGFTCLDRLAHATANPESYNEPFRTEILTGQELCWSCKLRTALNPPELEAKGK
jgi:hypothetical protein